MGIHLTHIILTMNEDDIILNSCSVQYMLNQHEPITRLNTIIDLKTSIEFTTIVVRFYL